MAEGRVRTFVAIDPSPALHAALVQLKAELAATRADVRWVRDDALHCTLKFLGGVERKLLDAIPAALQETLSRFAPLRVVARGLGVFPSPQRPRIVWVGLDGEGLADLATAVDTALAGLGFEPERRPFTAHITLGRVNGRRSWDRLAERMRTRAGETLGSTDVVRVVVYSSDTRPDGAVYTPLWTIPLHESTLSQPE